ncbi:HelD family protein [Modestobacter sp. VKM Ac-2978]|uniref:HelD family protein n=1 Tax=Modestobacter sp. VKM Ac-2978 TaxID=3004132 RepID=UPI0022AA3ABF|nr:UvrD-helicase domain-containing protein [Modestobacter sp. VKM Ac-2978]MCZ2848026.1 AAA family ATPase [Modestobacter sp. VKM Ac-2978]
MSVPSAPAHPTAADPVLAAERDHLAHAAGCLTSMRAAAVAVADAGVDAWASERLGAARAERLLALAADPGVPAFFGRTDAAGGTDPETFHIGRRHVRDAAGDPVVIDWRAPMSRPFYQASAAQPQGLLRRRRFGFADGELTSYEDELLADGQDDGGTGELLRQDIERPRSGPMRDIVATIQPDQDDIVRAPLAESICVQGAPGTGKTAVGLHRAAYLLYTHGDQLARTGVLVVGPNRAFLRYIEQVLPALGEVEVDQATVASLTARVTVRAQDEPAVAVLKGDPRMAEVLRRALWGGIRKPTDSVQVTLSGRKYRIGEDRLKRFVDDLRRAGTSGVDDQQLVHYAAGRERLAMGLAEYARRLKEAGGGSPTDAETRRTARSAEVRAFCDAVWPAVDAAGLVHDLFTDPERLARAARGVLTEEEQALLHWPKPPRSVRAARWTAADAVLVDEVAGMLERTPGYGHVVVDEAQDLSPMECRAVARRLGAGSLTVLGDLAQATSPWSVADWSQTLTALGRPATTVRPLTRGYRVPGEVLDFANRLLPAIAPGLAAATAARREPGALQLRPVGTLAGPLAEVVGELAARAGSTGVVCADASVAEVVGVLTAAGLDVAPLADDGSAPARVSVVPAGLVKGLEFDHVVVVEPAAIVAAEPRGLHRLYVVLTRAVSSLVVLHHADLPDLLVEEITAVPSC